MQQPKVAVVAASSYLGGGILSALREVSRARAAHGAAGPQPRGSSHPCGAGRLCHRRPGAARALPAPVDAADWVRGDLSDHAFVKEATEGCCSIIDLACQLVPPCDSIEQQLANDGGVLDACLFAGLAHGAQVIFTSGNFSIPTKNR